MPRSFPTGRSIPPTNGASTLRAEVACFMPASPPPLATGGARRLSSVQRRDGNHASTLPHIGLSFHPGLECRQVAHHRLDIELVALGARIPDAAQLRDNRILHASNRQQRVSARAEPGQHPIMAEGFPDHAPTLPKPSPRFKRPRTSRSILDCDSPLPLSAPCRTATRNPGRMPSPAPSSASSAPSMLNSSPTNF